MLAWDRVDEGVHDQQILNTTTYGVGSAFVLLLHL